MSDRPPPWGEPGYLPPAPTRERLEATRRSARLGCLILATPAVVFFVLGVVGYATLEPGEDDFGAGMAVVYALVFGIPAVVLGLRWRAASRSLRQQAEEDH